MPYIRYLWQMLLPYVLADVIANFVEDVNHMLFEPFATSV